MHDLTATKFVCHVRSDRSGLTTTSARRKRCADHRAGNLAHIYGL
jgi:hypothetical protein